MRCGEIFWRPCRKAPLIVFHCSGTGSGLSRLVLGWSDSGNQSAIVLCCDADSDNLPVRKFLLGRENLWCVHHGVWLSQKPLQPLCKPDIGKGRALCRDCTAPTLRTLIYPPCLQTESSVHGNLKFQWSCRKSHTQRIAQNSVLEFKVVIMRMALHLFTLYIGSELKCRCAVS